MTEPCRGKPYGKQIREAARAKRWPALNIVALCDALSRMEREWRTIVGPTIAMHARPTSYEEGVLVITVDSPSVMNDLNFRRQMLRKSIESASRVAIRDLRIELRGGRRAPHGRVI